MRKTPGTARSKSSTADPVAPAADDPVAREPRGARRKRETREKLLDAAFQLMAERGMDAVAINEITEAADVGFGSFYNHFDSKEAIYAALIDAVFDEFGDALDRLVANIDDPAEVISISVRHTIMRARREPLWGRLLVREGFSAKAISRGLGVRLMRDLQKGIAKKRFQISDPLMIFILVGAGVLGAVTAELELESTQGAALQQLGLSVENVAERATAALLHYLGIGFEEAAAISKRTLPSVM